VRREKKKVYDYKKALRDNERKLKPKKSNVEINPKDEVKEMFLDWFRKNRKTTKVMKKESVVRDILRKLDSKQNKVLDIAMEELKTSGLIEVESDGVTLVLTDLGLESI